MADEGYCRVTRGSKTFIFIWNNASENLSRDISELPLPYVKDILIYDQVTTTDEIQITGAVQCGSGYPYSTTKAARTAFKELLGDTVMSSVTLEAGSWDGSFNADSSKNWNLPDGTQTMVILEAQCSESPEGLDRLSVNFTFKMGSVL